MTIYTPIDCPYQHPDAVHEGVSPPQPPSGPGGSGGPGGPGGPSGGGPRSPPTATSTPRGASSPRRTNPAGGSARESGYSSMPSTSGATGGVNEGASSSGMRVTSPQRQTNAGSGAKEQQKDRLSGGARTLRQSEQGKDGSANTENDVNDEVALPSVYYSVLERKPRRKDGDDNDDDKRGGAGAAVLRGLGAGVRSRSPSPQKSKSPTRRPVPDAMAKAQRDLSRTEQSVPIECDQNFIQAAHFNQRVNQEPPSFDYSLYKAAVGPYNNRTNFNEELAKEAAIDQSFVQPAHPNQRFDQAAPYRDHTLVNDLSRMEQRFGQSVPKECNQNFSQAARLNQRVDPEPPSFDFSQYNEAVGPYNNRTYFDEELARGAEYVDTSLLKDYDQWMTEMANSNKKAGFPYGSDMECTPTNALIPTSTTLYDRWARNHRAAWVAYNAWQAMNRKNAKTSVTECDTEEVRIQDVIEFCNKQFRNLHRRHDRQDGINSIVFQMLENQVRPA